MKLHLFLTLAVLSSVPAVRADVEVTMAELRKIGFLPLDKAELRPEEKLDIKRRNPFAERKKVVAARPTEQVETEESKLRTFFDKQKVTGVMKFGDKFTISMGRLTLETGKIVPPIIPNQTHILRVLKVTDSELEIGWVEDSGVGLDPAIPRKIRKKINLRPIVQELLVSAEDNSGDNPQTYAKDDNGKVIVPKQSMLPNPSDLVNELPPGSDTNPAPVLTEQERQELQNATESTSAGNPAPQASAGPIPAPVPDAVPAPAAAPEAAPAGNEGTEDSVQPDPDLNTPGPTPAGPPGGK